MKSILLSGCIAAALFGCNGAGPTKEPNNMKPSNFGEDVTFLQQHLKNVVVLKNGSDSGRLVVTGDYQARVMTSTTGGDKGKSFGWINYNLVSSQQYAPHINAFGGEERFWLGPEGGQYALFFPPGKPFDFANWQTPGLIDTAHHAVTAQSENSITYQQDGTIQNYKGSAFHLQINRTIRLLNNADIVSSIGFALPAGISSVAYETDNTITNKGDSSWQEENGLLSIWLLGMFKPSDQTAIVAPFRSGPDAKQHITDDYFGKIPAQNLQLKDSLLLFRADGKSRGKLGLSPLVAKKGAGSIDLENNTLTVLLYDVVPQGRYVNSKWELQKEPFKGDAVNCYNDGPLADGTQMGPFYEVESSSDARALKAGESLRYRQTTLHFEGDRKALQVLAMQLWQLPLEDVQHFLTNK
ncbi:DUF6786 family protein [Chitinophaga ginsengisegetis]|uniref:DUF6786 family protein n=1 Tax=Chitinophaga ginsengisegetis TaxID=393003 RepID=UPI000DBAC4A8|nr:DUF6786 family protein [Chitinophaga ginsengisegetis]MDR6570590.1 hypothetical protein [Chitinophaga ginsengisegetis]MDR6650324.1 hypothetical protein [Chitinophaga ginsengisegetis]MDR6656557.1 hypothetical protein [Chitinophaga ginsengisegetis]